MGNCIHSIANGLTEGCYSGLAGAGDVGVAGGLTSNYVLQFTLTRAAYLLLAWTTFLAARKTSRRDLPALAETMLDVTQLFLALATYG